jgi:hypothetical protein
VVLGAGTTTTCPGAGTPHLDQHGDRTSPDCGHRCSRPSTGQPGATYPVAAASCWTGAGDSDQIDLDLTTGAEIRVGDVQVLVAAGAATRRRHPRHR